MPSFVVTPLINQVKNQGWVLKIKYFEFLKVYIIELFSFNLK